MSQETAVVKSFDYVVKSFSVRTVIVDGEIYFVAADVCKILGIKNVTQAVNRLDKDERAMFNIGRSPINGGGGETNCVNESGLYHLIFMSRKPAAKKFRKWVTSEVLPSIRKTGSYSVSDEKIESPASEEETLPDEVIDQEKFLIDAWNWLSHVTDLNTLSNVEVSILFNLIRIHYYNTEQTKTTAYKLARLMNCDVRTIKNGLIKLASRNLIKPPFKLNDYVEF